MISCFRGQCKGSAMKWRRLSKGGWQFAKLKRMARPRMRSTSSTSHYLSNSPVPPLLSCHILPSPNLSPPLISWRLSPFAVAVQASNIQPQHTQSVRSSIISASAFACDWNTRRVCDIHSFLSSNVRIGQYVSYASHPLRTFPGVWSCPRIK